MNIVVAVPLSFDLTEFTEFLWLHRVPHRVVEQGEQQIVVVADNVDSVQLRDIFEQWRHGSALSDFSVARSAGRRQSVTAAMAGSWLTLTLIVASIGLSMLIGFGSNLELLVWFTILNPYQYGADTTALPAVFDAVSAEPWRVISPIFLHFSIAHLAFNLLWMWIVARRIEMHRGAFFISALVIISGVVSNIAQFIDGGPLFGGMSGVMYAVIGYAWWFDRQQPVPRYGVSQGLMVFMLVWLALGYTDVLSAIGFGSIANTAHLAGLVAGVLFGTCQSVLGRRQ